MISFLRLLHCIYCVFKISGADSLEQLWADTERLSISQTISAITSLSSGGAASDESSGSDRGFNARQKRNVESEAMIEKIKV